jgi:hypothetical protein
MGLLKGVFLIGLVIISFYSNAQRYARASGNWNSAIWASTKNGVAGSAAVPIITDDVFTNGFQVTVNGSFSCHNVFVSYNVANSLIFASGRTLTFTGTLSGWDDTNNFEEYPITTVMTFASASRIISTGASVDPFYTPYVLFLWDQTVPIGRITFQFGAASTFNILNNLNVSGILTVQSGTLQTDPNAYISCSGASLTINPGASLITNDPIHGGTATTSVGILTINGTLTTSSYVNSASFILGPSAILNSTYSGVDQTEGWWFQTTRPTSFSLDATSIVNLSAGANQNIYSRPYGNLTLGGTGTKSVAGVGSINIAGNLLFSSAGVTYLSSQPTVFDGATSTSISGGGTANFNGGLQVNKSAGTLTLNQNISIQNGLTLTVGVFDLGSNTINLSGNLVNNATLTPSTSTLSIISGSTTISGSSSTSLGNLTITASGNLVASANLSIHSNFTNNGTYNANNGTITFDGPAAQVIQGSTNTSFNNIVYNNNSSLTVSTPQSLIGVLSITTSSGVFNANGNLTLVSTSTSDARIAQITNGGSISGNVTVQRYLPNSGSLRAYRYLASPVTNATVSQWKSSFPITGTFNDPSTPAEWPAFPTLTQANPSMYSYNEAHTPTTTVEDRFETFPPNGSNTSSTTLVNGKGYSSFVRQQVPITLSLTGAPQQGSVGVAVTAQSAGGNDGWNLIGNPYPAPINWANVTVPGGVANSIVIKDNTNNFGQGAGTFVSFASGIGIPASYTGTISLGQAFWVRATSGATIIFQEDDKEAISNPKFVRRETVSNLVRVNLSGNGKQDELVIRLADGALDKADNSFDGYKLKNDYLSFSSLSSDGFKMAINAQAQFSGKLLREVKSFPFAIEGNGTWVLQGNYKISFSEMETLDNGASIILKDTFLNDSLLVTSQTPDYSFTITNDPKTFTDRFKVIIARTNVITAIEEELFANQINVFPNPTDGIFTLEVSKDISGKVRAMNGLGVEIGEVQMIDQGKFLKGQFDLREHPAGLYFIKVSDGAKVFIRKVIKN